MIPGSETGKADSKALTPANWNWQREEQTSSGGRLYCIQRTHGCPTAFYTGHLGIENSDTQLLGFNH